MKVTSEKPPIYDEANALFKLEENKIKAVFTYGDTLHNPEGIELDPMLIRHEETHMEQQEGSHDVAATWYKRYFQDAGFRIDMEAEAYGAQYKLFCQINKDRNTRARYLSGLASMLSGKMYGNAVMYVDAIKQIRAYAEHPLM